MNVGCLVPYPLDRAPSQRYRLEQWRAPLAAAGVKLDFFPLLDPETNAYLHKEGHLIRKAKGVLAGCAARIEWALRRASDYDVVVIHREAILLGVDWIELYLASRVPTVFDFDDALWIANQSEANRRFGFLKGFAKVNRILQRVSAVAAGCGYLADHARQFNGNVSIVPTSIDLATYSPPRTHEATDVLTVGWTGSLTTGPYLETLREPLRRAAASFPLRMVVVGAEVAIPGVDVRCEPWTPAGEVPTIQTFDVGLKPAPREEWAKGKCALKTLQYMALGVPPIAVRFGTDAECVEDGVSGLLCDTDDDWVRALERLRDVEERRRLGAAARLVVEKEYSATVCAEAFRRVLVSAQTTFRQKTATHRFST